MNIKTSSNSTNKEIEKILKEKKDSNVAYCPNCGNKISINKAFCNRFCRIEHFSYVKIQMPVRFALRLINKLNKNEREKELKQYAIRHDFKYRLVIRKIKEIAAHEGLHYND